MTPRTLISRPKRRTNTSARALKSIRDTRATAEWPLTLRRGGPWPHVPDITEEGVSLTVLIPDDAKSVDTFHSSLQGCKKM